MAKQTKEQTLRRTTMPLMGKVGPQQQNHQGVETMRRWRTEERPGPGGQLITKGRRGRRGAPSWGDKRWGAATHGTTDAATGAERRTGCSTAGAAAGSAMVEAGQTEDKRTARSESSSPGGAESWGVVPGGVDLSKFESRGVESSRRENEVVNHPCINPSGQG